MTVRAALALAWAVALAAVPAAAAPPDRAALYTGRAVITGRDNEPERRRGFIEALDEVAGRVAGAPAPDALRADATAFVAGFDLLDRKQGIQVSDEQGTRDRAYVLTVRFDPDRLGAALRAAGLAPWEGERPAILARLTVDDTVRRYRLTQDSPHGYGPREALRSLARRLMVPLRLPDTPGDDRPRPDEAVLEGTLAMDGAGLWTLDWRLDGAGAARGGRIERVSFDVALRAAVDASLAAFRR